VFSNVRMHTYGHEQLSATVHPKIATIKDHNGIPEELYSGIGMLVDFAREEREQESQDLLMDLVGLANDVSNVDLYRTND